MIRRINLAGGPGCGKTTTAARLFGELSARGHRVEHVREYIKKWAYASRKPQSYDQLYVFAKQVHAEDSVLRHVLHLVTDCPLLVCVAYCKYYGFPAAGDVLSVARRFESEFPSVHILLNRVGIPYVQEGRYQPPCEAALSDLDRLIETTVRENVDPDTVFGVLTTDFQGVLAVAEKAMEGA